MSSAAATQRSAAGTQSELPKSGRIATVLAGVLAVLVVVAAVDLLALMPGYQEGRKAVENYGGKAELILDGIALLISAGMLGAGAVLLRRGLPRGRSMLVWGAVLDIVIVLLWLGRIQHKTALFLAIAPVVLGILVATLATSNTMLGWYSGTPAAEKQSLSQRLSVRWNSLARPQQWAFCVIVLLLLVVAPYLDSGLPILGAVSTEPGTDFPIALFNAARYALVAVGLNVVVGQAGLLDLGYVGFFAVGAYVTALLTSSDSTVRLFTDPNSKWAWISCVPIAMGITMIFGVILGGPTLRLRGDYLAIVTLGFGEIVRLVADNVPQLRGQSGFQNIAGPPGNAFVQLTAGRPFYWLTLGIIVAVLLLVGNLERSRVGRAWVAIRDDEDAAEIMGVPTFKFKLWAFAIGAAVGGISGAIYAGQIGFVNNQKFDPVTSILFLAAVVLGGAGNKVGVLIGAFLISYIPDRFTSIAEDKYLIFGAALIGLMIFRPQGLLGARQRLLAFGRSAYQRITGGPERLDTGTGAFSTDSKTGAMAGPR